MAKKNNSSKQVSGSSIFDMIQSFDGSAEVLSESKTAVIKDYISTGNYIVNAAITGSLFKGVPSGRITCLAGENSTGKSFMAVSICRNAQAQGYTPIYFDSENSIDIDFVKRLGCDPSNFIIRPVKTISEVSTFISNTCERVLSVDKNERPKILFVLDSLGNLTSNKEYATTVDGGTTKDMTKQQEVKALFRTNTTNLGLINAPFIVISHVYKTLDLFAKTIVTGGSGIGFSSSVTLMLSTAKLDDRESDKIAEKKAGEYVKTGVVVTAKVEKSRFTIPQKVRFQIPFFKEPNPYVGLDQYVTWDNSGLMLYAKLLDDKQYNKLSDSEKSTCESFEFTDGGITKTLYAYPKNTAKTFVSKSHGKEFPMSSFFTKEIFTDELLHKLDDEVIRPLFELPSHESNKDIDEMVNVCDIVE